MASCVPLMGGRANVEEHTIEAPSGTYHAVALRSYDFDVRAWSANSVMFFRRAGESSSACAITSSSEPYCATSCAAVLSPIPGTPGMLSDVSPLRPMKSGTSSGGMP